MTSPVNQPGWRWVPGPPPAAATETVINFHTTESAPPARDCVKTASCEDGDHTYSWPCDLALTEDWP